MLDHGHRDESGASTEAHDHATPGKHTQIEREHPRGRRAHADDGDSAERTDLRLELQAHALGAAQKWGQALTDRRLVRLCEHEGGWNALWEIAFYLASNQIAGGGVRLAGSLVRAARPAGDAIKGVFVFATRGMRIPTRVAVNAAANTRNAAEATFLEHLQNAPVDWAMGVIDAAAALSNDDLRELVAAIDPVTVLTFEHFQHEIGKLIGRWVEQVFAVGQRSDGADGRYESCAWITPRDGGVARLARVTRATPDGLHPMVPVAFRQWVDADLQADAIAQWERAFPGQGIERTTLDQLADVPAAARAWERSAGFPAAGESAEIPYSDTSHEAARKR